MVRRPPSGIASRAFTARLTITCSSWPGSARTLPRCGCSTVARRMSSPMSRRSIFSMSGTRALRLMTFGWRTWPAEREQLVRQPGGALCGLINLFDVVAAVIAGGKIGEQEIGVSTDRGEDVVEIVRHAARQPA